jgi:multidrug efflux pump subunit AcrA (membrane-fusion protein)
MQVRARVNQADVAYLEEGQPVRIGLDAYPDLSFPGKLERIGAIGITSNMSQRVHTFIAVFSISGSDPRLMPDLSAAVDIELQLVARVLLAPRDAVVETKDGAYVVVKNGSATEQRAVKLGPKNAAEVVIESGVDEGATVVRNPSS